MSTLYFSNTSGNVEGDTALNAVNPRAQVDLESVNADGALEVYVDPRVLNTKLDNFNDENDIFSNNSISITLNELISLIAEADSDTTTSIAAIDPTSNNYTSLANGSGSGEKVNALEFPIGVIDGDLGRGVKSLGYFRNLKENLASEVSSWLSNRFDVKGEELFEEESYIATGSGSGWAGSGSGTEGDKRLLLALLREIAAQPSGSGSGTKGDDSLFRINSCTEQIRNAVDSFKGSGYANNGRAVTNDPLLSSVTGYFEGEEGGKTIILASTKDSNGNLYFGGYTKSSFGGSGDGDPSFDGFVGMIAAGDLGNGLSEATPIIFRRLGEQGKFDRITAMVVDNDGNLYFGGGTSSRFGGSGTGDRSMDTYVGMIAAAELNSGLSETTPISYRRFGDQGVPDEIYAMAVDNDNNLYFGGDTGSSFGGPGDSDPGAQDGFVGMIAAGDLGSGLSETTPIHFRRFGEQDKYDLIYAMVVDNNGNLYFGGRTQSRFGGSGSGDDAVDVSGVAYSTDGFVGMISADRLGSGLSETTPITYRRFGERGKHDFILAMVIDNNGNLYFGGRTQSSFGGSGSGDSFDGFVGMIAAADLGSGLSETTAIDFRRFGDQGKYDQIVAMAVDDDGNLYFGGRTQSSFGGSGSGDASYDGFVGMIAAADLGSGLSETTAIDFRRFGERGEKDEIHAMVVTSNKLYVGGNNEQIQEDIGLIREYDIGSGFENSGQKIFPNVWLKNYPAVSFGFQNQDEIVWATNTTSVYGSGGIRAPGNGTSVTDTNNWKGIAISFSVPIGREPVPGGVDDAIVGDNNPNTSTTDGSLSFELYVPLVLVCSRPPSLVSE